jgi:transcriptional regulator with XRE-family HTH domain
MNRDQRAAYGPVIREARKAKGLDQETLAEMTGISRRTIGSIERGDTVAQREPLVKLLTVLDLMPRATDDDVTSFLVVIAPLLQQVEPELRPRLMQDLVGVVLTEIRHGARITQMPRRRSLSDPGDELPAVADKGDIEGPGEDSI